MRVVIEKGECIIEDGEGRSKKYREAGVVARRLSLKSFDPRLERCYGFNLGKEMVD